MIKKIILYVSIFLVVSSGIVGTVVLLNQDEEPNGNGDTQTEELLTISEVILTDDETYVETTGIVIGFDMGMRHVIIEEPNGEATIQIFRGSGFTYLRVGDEVLVKGVRTYDRGLNRINPQIVDILSRGNSGSFNNPIVIDASELFEWTSANRMNSDIFFKYYRFTNVEILSSNGTYAFIDDQYDETGGRGIKIGIKDTSRYPADNFIVGQNYTFDAILYGVSDDFFDENLSAGGTVLRLSVLTEGDVQLNVTGESQILTEGRQAFLVGETKPNFSTYFTILDPVDGVVAVNQSMITESIDMNIAGTYEIEINYENSAGHLINEIITIIVQDEVYSVSDALDAPLGSKMILEGVVIGYGMNGNNKQPFVIEDPENGRAIEFWANGAIHNYLEVGDLIRIYTNETILEKGLPRLGGYTVLSVISKNNDLTEASLITDLKAWSDAVLAGETEIFGRYTFTATVVHQTTTYAFFSRGSSSDRFIQFAVHANSFISYDWQIGTTYTVTGLIYGISDPIIVLDTTESTNPTVRFGVMKLDDIEVHETETFELTVSEAIDIPDATSVMVEGVVIGYGLNSSGNKEPMIIEDPETGLAIELWTGGSAFNDVVGGDLIRVSGLKMTEKGLPRISGPQLIEIISSNHSLTDVREIDDLMVWAEEKADDSTDILGRYTFTATIIHITGTYAFFTRYTSGDRFIQFAVHSNSVLSYDWELGRSYTVTGVIYGISDPISILDDSSGVPTIRFGIMHEDDVEAHPMTIPDLTVTEAVNSPNATPMTVEGVVIGYGLNGTNKQPVIIEDPTTGVAIEIWTSGATYNAVAVGDLIRVSGVKVLEKDLPRLDQHQLLEIVSSNHTLSEPQIIDNLLTWADEKYTTKENVLGRYTFTATIVHLTGTYQFFTRHTSGDRFIQFAVHTNSAVSYGFSVGTTYTVTGLVYGISDPISILDNPSGTPTIRFGIMDINDIEAEDLETLPLTVTEAINTPNSTSVVVEGVVIGYGLNGANKQPVIMEDPNTGLAIELWTSGSIFNSVSVGDLILVSGLKVTEKGLPRISGPQLDEIISQNNPLTAPKVIEDLMVFAEELANDFANVLGRYTFIADIVDAGGSSYKYFTRWVSPNPFFIQTAIHANSAVKFNEFTWVQGTTYEVTLLLYGISDPIENLSTQAIVFRFGLMSLEDVSESVEASSLMHTTSFNMRFESEENP